MEFLNQVRLIQGGMGVHVSNWRLAKAVASQRPGVTVGTVSGTALDVVYVRLLQLGDPGGHARRALRALDETFGVDTGRTICDRYFIEGGKAPDARFRSAPMHMVRTHDGRRTFPLPNGTAVTVPLKLDDEIIELLIATGFAEVWLAKEGHNGKVFINFLNKIELPLIYVLYGAMLAGVDGRPSPGRWRSTKLSPTKSRCCTARRARNSCWPLTPSKWRVDVLPRSR
jgi:nitronate monooxygenase